jgi:hypothetical protein
MIGPRRLKKVGNGQRLADGTDELHGFGEELGMEIDDAALVDGTVELVDIIREVHTMVLDDVGSTTDARSSIVAMLSDFVSGTCDDEARSSRDIECVLAVTASSHHVDVTVTVERHRHARFEDAVTEAEELVDSDAAHLNSCQQGSDLCVVKLTLRDGDEQLFGFLTCEFLVVEELVENFLDVHISMSLSNYYFLIIEIPERAY